MSKCDKKDETPIYDDEEDHLLLRKSLEKGAYGPEAIALLIASSSNQNSTSGRGGGGVFTEMEEFVRFLVDENKDEVTDSDDDVKARELLSITTPSLSVERIREAQALIKTSITPSMSVDRMREAQALIKTPYLILGDLNNQAQALPNKKTPYLILRGHNNQPWFL